MKKIYLLFIFPMFVFGQTNSDFVIEDESDAYKEAISEYIKAIYSKYEQSIDTLFIGKHADFPDISLPNKIQNTYIILLLNVNVERKMNYRNSLTFINMIGSLSHPIYNFKLVTFIVEKTPSKINWWPVHDCNIDFKCHSKSKTYSVKDLKFEYRYSNKFSKIK
jgi:hypothetical protein